MSVMDKRATRTAHLARRRAIPAEDRLAADQALAAGVKALVKGLGTIAGYAPMRGEPGGEPLLAALRDSGSAVLLPVLRADLDLAWARWTGELTPPGPAGVREPVGALLEPLAIAEADLVLVPAVAVDRHGVRLGRGGGSYDRALTRVRPGVPIVAVIDDADLVDHLPADAHDVHVTDVLTPSGLTSVRSRPSA